MSNGDSSVDQNETRHEDLTSVRRAVDAAVALAEQYDHVYREKIFEMALGHALEGYHSSGAGEDVPDERTPRPPGSLEGIAGDLDVPADALRRVIDVSENQIRIYGDVGGSSRSSRANRVSAVYLYLKEILLDEREAHLEELKEVADGQPRRALDGNFTRNLRNGSYLTEAERNPGSTDKRYRLMPAGVEAAKEILRHLAGEE